VRKKKFVIWWLIKKKKKKLLAVLAASACRSHAEGLASLRLHRRKWKTDKEKRQPHHPVTI
jgi:hypothetical protein